jgi:hypothetical protein
MTDERAHGILRAAPVILSSVAFAGHAAALSDASFTDADAGDLDVAGSARRTRRMAVTITADSLTTER